MKSVRWGLVGCLCLFHTVANAQEIQTVGGQTLVVNPEAPAEERFEAGLTAAWEVGGLDDDAIFGVITQLVEDDRGNIYLLDSQLSEVQVYAPSGEWLRTIGREGEGPGEFRNSSDMYLGPGRMLGILQVFPGKIVQLTLDGEPGGNYPLPPLDGGGFQLVYVARGLPDRVVLAGGHTGQGDQTTWLRALDGAGNVVAKFYEETTPMRFGGHKFEEAVNRNFTQRFAVAPDGRVAAALDFLEYEIHIWNPDGTLDRIIQRPEYQPVKRTGKERKLIHHLFSGFTSWNPGSTYEESEFHQTVGAISFREDGSLWVLPAEGMWRCEAGEFARFDVYDREGRFARRVSFAGDDDPVNDGIFFTRDRMYVVTDLLSALMANFAGGEDEEVEMDDPEPMAVRAFDLDLPSFAP